MKQYQYHKKIELRRTRKFLSLNSNNRTPSRVCDGVQLLINHDFVADSRIVQLTSTVVEEGNKIYNSDPEEAEKKFTRAIQIDPKNEYAYYYRGLFS